MVANHSRSPSLYMDPASQRFGEGAVISLALSALFWEVIIYFLVQL